MHCPTTFRRCESARLETPRTNAIKAPEYLALTHLLPFLPTPLNTLLSCPLSHPLSHPLSRPLSRPLSPSLALSRQRWTARSTARMSPAYSPHADDVFCWVGVIMYLPPSQTVAQVRTWPLMRPSCLAPCRTS